MKTNFYSAIILFCVLVNGCISAEGPQGERGPQGPQGPEGPQGLAGESGYVFEFDNINFTSPNYESFLTYPDNFEGLSSDVALVYLLWGVENVNGEDLDIWRPLPQTIFTEEGLLIYNFDFTVKDVRLFLTADFPLDHLTAIDTDEWIARVVVVPGSFWNSGRIDKSIGYYDLIAALGLHDTQLKRRIIERR